MFKSLLAIATYIHISVFQKVVVEVEYLPKDLSDKYLRVKFEFKNENLIMEPLNTMHDNFYVDNGYYYFRLHDNHQETESMNCKKSYHNLIFSGPYLAWYEFDKIDEISFACEQIQENKKNVLSCAFYSLIDTEDGDKSNFHTYFSLKSKKNDYQITKKEVVIKPYNLETNNEDNVGYHDNDEDNDDDLYNRLLLI